jgi:hypothetical protein
LKSEADPGGSDMMDGKILSDIRDKSRNELPGFLEDAAFIVNSGAVSFHTLLKHLRQVNLILISHAK